MAEAIKRGLVSFACTTPRGALRVFTTRQAADGRTLRKLERKGEPMAFAEQLVNERADLLTAHLSGDGDEPAVCPLLRSETRMQQWFVLLYQGLIFTLALATVLLLIGFLWRVSKQADIAAGLQAAGAVVTGVAAGWVEKQRHDARLALAAAERALQRNGCRVPAGG